MQVKVLLDFRLKMIWDLVVKLLQSVQVTGHAGERKVRADWYGEYAAIDGGVYEIYE